VSDFVHSAGGFRCTSDVGQGPLAGCLSGGGRALGHGRASSGAPPPLRCT
jgi:hypothetical protein